MVLYVWRTIEPFPFQEKQTGVRIILIYPDKFSEIRNV